MIVSYPLWKVAHSCTHFATSQKLIRRYCEKLEEKVKRLELEEIMHNRRQQDREEEGSQKELSTASENHAKISQDPDTNFRSYTMNAAKGLNDMLSKQVKQHEI